MIPLASAPTFGVGEWLLLVAVALGVSAVLLFVTFCACYSVAILAPNLGATSAPRPRHDGETDE